MTSQTILQAPPEHSNITPPLTSENIKRLYAKIAIPMAFAMVISGMYNMVDAYFIAKYIGVDAFAAVSAVFPFQMLVIALGAFISNGASILVSQYWGAQKNHQAQSVINNAFTLVLLVSIVLSILVVSSTSQMLRAIGLSDQLLTDASAYFIPITLSAVLVLSLSLITDLLRAQTNMQALLLIILLGAVSNALLDFLFIVVFNMGISGAASATILCQFVGSVLGLKLLSSPNSLFKIAKLKISLDFEIISRFLSLGLPVFMSYLGASIVMLVVNTNIARSTLGDSEQLLAAYGIISRINIFIILPLIAISQASQTIIAHNFGAKHVLRVKKAGIAGALIATCYLSLMTLCLYLLPRQIITLFTQQESLIEQAQTIAGIMFLLLPLSGISTISVAYFQATGKAKLALLLSTAQIYLFLLPGILLIGAKLELHNIWYAFPLTHCLSLLLAVSLLWTQQCKLKLQNLSYLN
jgi:putative MATE family efflux protein